MSVYRPDRQFFLNRFAAGVFATLVLAGCGVKFNSLGSFEQSEQLDLLPPSVYGLTVPADTYVAGENLDILVTFSESVTITGTPRIEIDVGGNTRYAEYVPGAPGAIHTFRYVIQAGDSDTDGIDVASTIDLNGGTIVDDADWPAVLTYTPPPTTSVLVDGVVPTIGSVTLPPNDTYTLGENVDFVVSFDQPMTVSGSRLTLTVGGKTRYANYLSGSGTANITYRYTVLGSDFDSDGITLAGSIDLNGGSITDANGNPPASLAHGAGSTAGILVETYSILSGTTSMDLTVNLDEVGDVHYAIYNANPGVMTAADVRSAAVGATGGSLVKNGTIAITTPNVNVVELVTGLNDDTTYYVRIIPEGTVSGLHGDSSVRSFTKALPATLVRVNVTSATWKAGQTIRYGLFRPEAYYKESTNTYPTIIALHGNGENASSAADDSDANFETTIFNSSGLLREINQGWLPDFPFIVIQPRCPGYGGTDCWNWAGAVGLIDELLEHAKANQRVDTTRVYITGLSTGGGGVLKYAKAYPAKIAAAAPIAMTDEGVTCASLKNIPFWFFHNINDSTQSSNNSVTARDSLVGCPSPVPPKLTRYNDCVGVCHNAWSKTWRLTGGTVEPGDDAFGSVYDWFLNYTK